MSKYIWEELKRVIIKKKILIMAVFIVIIGFGLMLVLKTKSLEGELHQYKMLLNNQKSAMSTAKTDLKKAEFLRDIAGTEKQINDLEEELNAINSYDKSKLDEKIQKLEKENNPKNEYRIIKLKYEKAHNIEKSELRPRGMYVALEALTVFIPLFFLLTMIVFFADIVSGEYASNTIKNLVTRPIPRRKIIISKFIASTIFSVGTIIVSALIFLVEGGLRFSFSDYRLPFDTGAKYILDKSLPLTSLTSQMKYVSGSWTMVPLWCAFIELTLIITIISIAIISIIIFISTISKNSLISSLISFMLICGTSLWYIFSFAGRYLVSAKYGNFVKFLPMPYIVDNIQVLTGEISQQLTSTISIPFVIILCLAWTLIMMFLSISIFEKRDFD